MMLEHILHISLQKVDGFVQSLAEGWGWGKNDHINFGKIAPGDLEKKAKNLPLIVVDEYPASFWLLPLY